MQKANEMLSGKLSKSGRIRKRNFWRRWMLLSAMPLLAALMLTGCASNSISSRAVAVQPLSSAIAEPADVSSFYQRLTSWRERVRDYLETEKQGSNL